VDFIKHIWLIYLQIRKSILIECAWRKSVLALSGIDKKGRKMAGADVENIRSIEIKALMALETATSDFFTVCTDFENGSEEAQIEISE